MHTKLFTSILLVIVSCICIYFVFKSGWFNFGGDSKLVNRRVSIPEALSSFKAQDLTQEDFSKLFGILLEDTASQPDFSIALVKGLPLSLQTYRGNKFESQIDLSNLWAIRSDISEEKLLSVISRYSKVSPDVLNGKPVILIRGEIDASAQLVKSGLENYIGEHVAGDIWKIVFLDGDEFFSPFNQKTSIDRHEMLAQSLRGLHEAIDDFEIMVTPYKGFKVLTLPGSGGNYESSLILVPELMEKIAKVIAGNLVVAVPARDLFFFTGSSDIKGLADLKDEMKKISESETSYPVSVNLYVLNNGAWSVFKNN